MAAANDIRAIEFVETSGFAAVLRAIKTAIARHVVYRQTVQQLSDLSNRDLIDLDIDRAQIKQMAAQAAANYQLR